MHNTVHFTNKLAFFNFIGPFHPEKIGFPSENFPPTHYKERKLQNYPNADSFIKKKKKKKRIQNGLAGIEVILQQHKKHMA